MRSGITLVLIPSVLLVHVACGKGNPVTQRLIFESSTNTAGRGGHDLFVPGAITTTRDGTIYVLDRKESCVKVFDSFLGFQHRVGKQGNRAGEFALPVDIAGWRDQVYVLDGERDLVQGFDRSGRVSRLLNATRTSYSFCISDEGSVFLWQPREDPCLLRLDKEGTPLGRCAPALRSPDGNLLPNLAILAVEQRVYVAYVTTPLVRVFDKDGTPVREFRLESDQLPETGHDGTITRDGYSMLPRVVNDICASNGYLFLLLPRGKNREECILYQCTPEGKKVGEFAIVVPGTQAPPRVTSLVVMQSGKVLFTTLDGRILVFRFS